MVFGCGGERDRTKRQRMGEVANRLADVVIGTDDNPRREDPDIIRQSILSTCPSGIELPDRREAIARGIDSLHPGEVLVIAGKGHETTQAVCRTTVEFSDRAAVQSVIDSNI